MVDSRLGDAVSMLFGSFDLIIAVLEFVCIFKYAGIGGCGSLWEIIFVAAILDFVVGICSWYDVRVSREEKGIGVGARIMKGVMFDSLCMAIRFWISGECEAFWLKTAPEIWMLLRIHFAMFWIYLIIALFCCIGNKSGDRSGNENRSGGMSLNEGSGSGAVYVSAA